MSTSGVFWFFLSICTLQPHYNAHSVCESTEKSIITKRELYEMHLLNGIKCTVMD